MIREWVGMSPLPVKLFLGQLWKSFVFLSSSIVLALLALQRRLNHDYRSWSLVTMI
jgi:hypothetical protein